MRGLPATARFSDISERLHLGSIHVVFEASMTPLFFLQDDSVDGSEIRRENQFEV